jgi:hypothetical protein
MRWTPVPRTRSSTCCPHRRRLQACRRPEGLDGRPDGRPVRGDKDEGTAIGQ